MKNRATEHQEQAALFSWAEFHTHRWPELALMFAIPNGGKRNKVTAAMLKAEGVKPGVPDICLPVTRTPCPGLYIEMKTGTGRLSSTQRSWLLALIAQGYRAEVCRGWQEAQQVIIEYLGGDEGEPLMDAVPSPHMLPGHTAQQAVLH